MEVRPLFTKIEIFAASPLPFSKGKYGVRCSFSSESAMEEYNDYNSVIEAKERVVVNMDKIIKDMEEKKAKLIKEIEEEKQQKELG